MSTLLLLNAVSTWALVGLIWTIQWVHYPLFLRVGPAAFSGYHAAHSLAITPLVGVLMLLEGVTALALLLRPPAGASTLLVWGGFLLVVAHLLVTALVSVPLHARLGQGFDADVIGRLVTTNWWRTAIWTTRGLIVMELLRTRLK